MRKYAPGKWEIVKINGKGFIGYKILGDWSSDYLMTSSWRMSSGIVEVIERGDFLEFVNVTGSVYKCHKNTKGFGFATVSVFEDLQKVGDVEIITLEQLKKELDK